MLRKIEVLQKEKKFEVTSTLKPSFKYAIFPSSISSKDFDSDFNFGKAAKKLT